MKYCKNLKYFIVKKKNEMRKLIKISIEIECQDILK